MGRGVLIIALGFILGCSNQRFYKSPWLVTERDAARYLTDALEHENADVRREAIERLSKSRFIHHDLVVDACSTIARTDSSEAVRVAAVRLIAEAGRPDSAAVLLSILDEASRATRHSGAGPGDWVTTEVLHALYFLKRNDPIKKIHRDRVVGTALRLLRGDPSREVRIAAAELLEVFPRRDVLDGLIAALDQRDFGVVYTVERSLKRLTGMTYDHDLNRWQDWLAAADDPFARRGELDDASQAEPEPNWWRRTVGSVRRAFTGS